MLFQTWVGQITPSQKAWHFEDLTTDPLIQTQYGRADPVPPPPISVVVVGVCVPVILSEGVVRWVVD